MADDLSCIDLSRKQCFQLLRSLIRTVEWLLSSCTTNVWDTYGSLSRVCAILDEILSHNLQFQGIQKYWHFICGLRWLKPDSGPPILHTEVQGRPDPQQECLQSHIWLQKSLFEHSLSSQLNALINDYDHLSYYYKDTAFMCNKSYTDVLLTCLKAVENNQPSLLADLDPTVITKPFDAVSEPKRVVAATPCSYVKTQNEFHQVRNKTNVFNCNEPNKEGFCTNINENQTCSLILQHNDNICNINSTLCKEKQNVLLKSKCSEIACLSNFLCSASEYSASSSNIISNSEENMQQKVLPHNSTEVSARLFEKNSDCKTINSFTTLNTGKNNYVKFRTQRFYSFPGMSSNFHPAINFRSSDDSKVTQIQEETDHCKNFPVKCDSNGSFLLLDVNGTEILSDVNNFGAKQGLEKDNSEKLSSSLADMNIASSSNFVASVDNQKSHHVRSKSDVSTCSHNEILCDDSDSYSEISYSSSLPGSLAEVYQKRQKSIFEGGQKIVVPTECFFPRPEQGQSLTSFLSSTEFNICAELDKENAHFCISEALISAIEHIKCSQKLKIVEEEAESDEEIRKLTQRIRIRRKERQKEKNMKCITLLSDGKTDTTTSQSASSPLSSYSSDFEPGDSIGSDDEDFEDLELSDRTESNLSSMKDNGLSLSMASLYSDADIKKMSSYPPYVSQDANREEKRANVDTSNVLFSAEAVALSLLKRFSEKQLPKASELQWLVSEQQAPQQLLPLPDSWPVSPDSLEEEYSLAKTRLRGNFEWAPPRPQIIWIIHAYPKRKEAIMKQKYRCAGCGMKIESSYIGKFRYCDYLGKFFCQCCHSNDVSYIPGRILKKWDFSKYYVSKFAYKLLDQMFADPLFNIVDINANLYSKVKQLGICRNYRIQLLYLKDFIRTCRNAKGIQKEVEQYPQYIFNEPHVYSIHDLLQVKNGELSKYMQQLVTLCTSHVMQCILCQAKGFICEICKKDTNIIFPFQLEKVSMCNGCGSCFHKKCFKACTCPKCIRIEERKKRLRTGL